MRRKLKITVTRRRRTIIADGNDSTGRAARSTPVEEMMNDANVPSNDGHKELRTAVMSLIAAAQKGEKQR